MVSTRSSQPSAMTPSDVYKIVVEAMREHVRVNEDKAYTIAIAAYPNSCDAHWHHKTIQEEFLTHVSTGASHIFLPKSNQCVENTAYYSAETPLAEGRRALSIQAAEIQLQICVSAMQLSAQLHILLAR